MFEIKCDSIISSIICELMLFSFYEDVCINSLSVLHLRKCRNWSECVSIYNLNERKMSGLNFLWKP